jgi:hypothetical protein
VSALSQEAAGSPHDLKGAICLEGLGVLNKRLLIEASSIRWPEFQSWPVFQSWPEFLYTQMNEFEKISPE